MFLKEEAKDLLLGFAPFCCTFSSDAYFMEDKALMYSKIQPRLKKQQRHSQYLSMTKTETWAFIKSHYKMVLCTLDSFGFPHAAPIWFVVVNDRIYFRAQPYKRKIKNILSRPQVCGVIEDGEKYTELRGVMIRGLAKVVDTDKALRKHVFDLLAEKYSSVRNTHRFPKTWQETYGKEHRVVVEFKPTNLVSWDNRKWISAGQSPRPEEL